MQKIGIALTLAMFAGAPAAADTLGVPGDFATIQSAIDAAVDGDVVLVAAGTYAERIDFLGKAITVESADGAGSTVIDGGGVTGWVVTAASGEGAGSVLRGFTVTGGFGQTASGADTGGGFLIQGASPTVEGCVFVGNEGLLGGGVKVVGGSPVFRETSFTGNNALQGAGLYIEFGDLTIEGSTFEGNSARGFGGALAIVASGDARVVDTEFLDNEAINAGFGGAVYVNHSTIDFSNLVFADNGKAEVTPGGFNSFTVSTGGGGAVYTTNTGGRINASRFDNNIAAAGTALYIAGGQTLEVVNSLFTRNGSFCGCGTGVIYTNTSAPVLANNTIADNGGFFGIYNYGGTYTVSNSIFAGQSNPIGGNYGDTRLEYSVYDNALFRTTLGPGNVQADDALLDAGNDYAPLPGSPAIDAGDNSLVPAGVTTDLLGNPRFADDPNTPDTGVGDAPIVDIGAIEFIPAQTICAGDMNGDGVMDLADLNMFITAFTSGMSGADMNGDGVLDLADVMMFASEMQNGCGVQ